MNIFILKKDLLVNFSIAVGYVGGDIVPGSASASVVATTTPCRSVVSDSVNVKKSTSICWLLCERFCNGPFVLSKGLKPMKEVLEIFFCFFLFVTCHSLHIKFPIRLVRSCGFIKTKDSYVHRARCRLCAK